MAFDPFTAIGNAITAGLDLLKTWFQGRQELSKQKAEVKKAEMDNRARLLRDEQSNNHEWEMANLADKDKWIRRVSFIMFASPFIIAIVAPEHVKNYFDIAISSIPNWYKVTWMAINGAVWGISSLKNPVSQIADVFLKK